MDAAFQESEVQELRELMRAVRDSKALVPVLLPIDDGLLCAVKRGLTPGSGRGHDNGPGLFRARRQRTDKPGAVVNRCESRPTTHRAGFSRMPS